MTVKKILLNKYNFYLVLSFLVVSIFGSVYIYNTKTLHHHLHIYKVQLPHLITIDREMGIGTKTMPMMEFYEFRDFIISHQGISNSCPNFSETVRMSIWEARNEIDWRFELKYANTKNILKCINQIVDAIENKRKDEISKIKKFIEFESSIFEESVKKVIQDQNFIEFKDFLEKEVKAKNIYGSDVRRNEILKILAAVMDVELGPDPKKEEKPFNFTDNFYRGYDNFLRGYIYNFLDSYKAFKYINNLTETKYQKFSEDYFLNKSIIKFNFAILFLLVLSILIINLKNLKKLF